MSQYSSTTYYVDFAAGNDTNNGTSLATAWKNLGRAFFSDWSQISKTGNTAQLYKPGDQVLVTAGDHHDIGAGITVTRANFSEPDPGFSPYNPSSYLPPWTLAARAASVNPDQYCKVQITNPDAATTYKLTWNNSVVSVTGQSSKAAIASALATAVNTAAAMSYTSTTLDFIGTAAFSDGVDTVWIYRTRRGLLFGTTNASGFNGGLVSSVAGGAGTISAVTPTNQARFSITSTCTPGNTVAAGASWTTGNNTITMSANNPGVAAGATVWDNTTGQTIGTVSSWPSNSTTLTLTANALHNSSGAADNLVFSSGVLANANGSWTTSSTTITMAAANPGGVSNGNTVWDGTSGQLIGTVQSWSGTTLTLTGKALHASSGASDTLVFSQGAIGLQFQNVGNILIKDAQFTGPWTSANPPTAGVSYSGSSGLTFLNYSKDPIGPIKVQNCVIAWHAQYGSGLFAEYDNAGYSDVVFQGVTFWGNNGTPFFTGLIPNPQRQNYYFQDVVLDRCEFFNNSYSPDNNNGYLIFLSNVKWGIVHRCYAWNNNCTSQGTGGGFMAFEGSTSRYLLFQKSAIIHTYVDNTNMGVDCGAFDFDGGVRDSVMQHCYSQDNAGEGFLISNGITGASDNVNNIVRFNISQNDVRVQGYGAIAFTTSGSSPVTRTIGTQVYNNTVYVSRSTTNTSNTYYAAVAFNSSVLLRKVAIYNNIFVVDQSTAGGSALVGVASDLGGDKNSDYRFVNNCWPAPASGGPIAWYVNNDLTNPTAPLAGTNRFALRADWTAATTQEAGNATLADAQPGLLSAGAASVPDANSLEWYCRSCYLHTNSLLCTAGQQIDLGRWVPDPGFLGGRYMSQYFDPTPRDFFDNPLQGHDRCVGAWAGTVVA